MKINLNSKQKIGLLVGVLFSLILLFIHNPFNGYYGCFDLIATRTGSDFQVVNLESYKKWYECQSEGAFFIKFSLISTWIFAQSLIVIFTLFWLWIFKQNSNLKNY
jgi:lipoprotein signal peptidase